MLLLSALQRALLLAHDGWLRLMCASVAGTVCESICCPWSDGGAARIAALGAGGGGVMPGGRLGRCKWSGHGSCVEQGCASGEGCGMLGRAWAMCWVGGEGRAICVAVCLFVYSMSLCGGRAMRAPPATACAVGGDRASLCVLITGCVISAPTCCICCSPAARLTDLRAQPAAMLAARSPSLCELAACVPLRVRDTDSRVWCA